MTEKSCSRYYRDLLNAFSCRFIFYFDLLIAVLVNVSLQANSLVELLGHGKFDTVKSAINSESWHVTHFKDTKLIRWLLSLVGKRVRRRV